MYSDADLDAAVEAGVLTPDSVAGFRAFAAAQRSSPAVDEEHFRLLTGFNDIFVSIATALMLMALAWIGSQAAHWFGAVLTGATSWGLSEYFTRKRRMALPSILLLLAFVLSAGFAGLSLILVPYEPGHGSSLSAAAPMALAAIAAYAHWRRFMVPITPAVASVAVVGIAVALLLAAFPAAKSYYSPMFLIGGISIFVLAMRWDISDPERKTRRSDVAFWLHLAAAPMMVHPAFALLGLSHAGLFNFGTTVVPGVAQPLDLGAAGAAVAIYIGLAAVALAIDRRALLVSSLFYVLYALSTLFRAAGSLTFSLALTGLVIGSGLLLLSAFWHRARVAMLTLLPSRLQTRLPPP